MRFCKRKQTTHFKVAIYRLTKKIISADKQIIIRDILLERTNYTYHGYYANYTNQCLMVGFIDSKYLDCNHWDFVRENKLGFIDFEYLDSKYTIVNQRILTYTHHKPTI